MSIHLCNAMTVDVEEHFQVQAFAGCINRNEWDGFDSRVEANVDRILEQFANAGVRATFFTLGWIAERHKTMVRQIVAAGHELASHGYDHTRADSQDPGAFRVDVGRSRRLLEDIGGVPVRGYRAATFSMNACNQWAFGVLEEEGYAYSSSVNPISHDLYGMPNASRVPYRPDGKLCEIPMTTVRALGRNFPCSGGGYFRLLPYAAFRFGLSSVNQRGQAGVFYFHPWEVDPEQPRIANCGWKSHFRHYNNLSRTAPRLDSLLRDFAWDRMDHVFADWIDSSSRGLGNAA
jgi:polysaccharide deacetylase family protein (PEP-CTERM system associated)